METSAEPTSEAFGALRLGLRPQPCSLVAAFRGVLIGVHWRFNASKRSIEESCGISRVAEERTAVY